MSRSLDQHHLDMMCANGSANQTPPEVHGFCDSQGMFHAFEGADGRRLVMAMKALEEKILANVEKSLVDMRKDIKQVNLKSDTASWMFRNIVAEQKEMTSRINELSIEALESRSDLLAQLEEVSREALESRSDLISITDELSHEAFESRMDCMASVEELEQKITAAFPLSMRTVESVETQLKQEERQEDREPRDIELDLLEQQKAKINDLLQQMEDKAKVDNLISGLQNVVSAAASVPPETAPTTIQSACDLDLSNDVDLSSKTPKESKNFDAWLQSSGSNLIEIPYSEKTSFAGDFYNGVATPAPFAFSKKSVLAAPLPNVHRPRPVARMTSSQSVPMLEPLF